VIFGRPVFLLPSGCHSIATIAYTHDVKSVAFHLSRYLGRFSSCVRRSYVPTSHTHQTRIVEFGVANGLVGRWTFRKLSPSGHSFAIANQISGCSGTCALRSFWEQVIGLPPNPHDLEGR